jgi:hypothetical protein
MTTILSMIQKKISQCYDGNLRNLFSIHSIQSNFVKFYIFVGELCLINKRSFLLLLNNTVNNPKRMIDFWASCIGGDNEPLPFERIGSYYSS